LAVTFPITLSGPAGCGGEARHLLAPCIKERQFAAVGVVGDAGGTRGRKRGHEGTRGGPGGIGSSFTLEMSRFRMSKGKRRAGRFHIRRPILAAREKTRCGVLSKFKRGKMWRGVLVIHAYPVRANKIGWSSACLGRCAGAK
jgi:hypothetical protein